MIPEDLKAPAPIFVTGLPSISSGITTLVRSRSDVYPVIVISFFSSPSAMYLNPSKTASSADITV